MESRLIGALFLFFILCIKAERNFGDDDYDFTSWRMSKNDKKLSSLSNNNRKTVGSIDDHGCPQEFLGRCVCEDRVDSRYDPSPRARRKFTVVCENSGFKKTDMLAHLPWKTEVLIFTGNHVRYLPPNVFGRENKNLKIVDMSQNEIEEIDGKAFHHVENVEILLLAHNNLSNDTLHMHPRVFSNFYNLKDLYLTNAFNDEIWSFRDLGRIFADSDLSKLEKLHLGLNELEIITDPNAFCQLPSLRHLYIPQNKLTEDVDLNTTCLRDLEVIDLRANLIRKITPSSSLWKLLNISNSHGEPIRIELLANPFNCDCNLKSFIKLLSDQLLQDPDRFRDNENIKCENGLPESNRGKYLRQVSETSCPLLVSSVAAGHVVAGIIWVLSIALVFIVLLVGYAYRGALCRTVRPLLTSSTQGVKYTSIEKNEEAEVAHV